MWAGIGRGGEDGPRWPRGSELAGAAVFAVPGTPGEVPRWSWIAEYWERIVRV